MAGGPREQREPAHEGAADAEDVKMHGYIDSETSRAFY
jgi:hypothetical protein